MTKYVPFVAHIRVVPIRGKRFEYVRDLQKIGVRVYDELITDSDLTLATPGGGQHASYGGTNGAGWGGYAGGLAVKPQMGQIPAQLEITGFIASSAANDPVHPDTQLFHTGSAQEGQTGNHGWDANPTSALSTLATSIKTKIETAVTAVLGSTDWNVFRLDVAGVVFGDKGYHFPR